MLEHSSISVLRIFVLENFCALYSITMLAHFFKDQIQEKTVFTEIGLDRVGTKKRLLESMNTKS